MYKTADLDSLQLSIANTVGEDLFALISSLIDQNAELMQKVQVLNSQKEPANSVVTEAHKQEETIKLLVEMVARDRASAIIKDAKTKAKIEADRILAEAKTEAQEIIEGKHHFAVEQGLLIINKAQEKALSILDDVRKQAEAITSKANQKDKLPTTLRSGFYPVSNFVCPASFGLHPMPCSSKSKDAGRTSSLDLMVGDFSMEA